MLLKKSKMVNFLSFNCPKHSLFMLFLCIWSGWNNLQLVFKVWYPLSYIVIQYITGKPGMCSDPEALVFLKASPSPATISREQLMASHLDEHALPGGGRPWWTEQVINTRFKVAKSSRQENQHERSPISGTTIDFSLRKKNLFKNDSLQQRPL